MKYSKGTIGNPEIFHLAIGPQSKPGQFLGASTKGSITLRKRHLT